MNGEIAPLERVRDELGAMELANSDLEITIETAGGGGFGDPKERPLAQVMADVRDGLVSREAARREYGVVIDGDGVPAAARVTDNCTGVGRIVPDAPG